MSVPLDYAQLKALAAVVREGSFEKAAHALHVTPSAISQRIRALEDRVGRLLVQRTTPADATPDGRILVQLAEQTALLEGDAWRRMGFREETDAPTTLAVAVNHDSLETWFVDAAARFAQHSSTTLALQSDDQDHTAELLRSGAVLGAVTASAQSVQGCNAHALGKMRYAATCSPAFHARHFSKGVNARSLGTAPVLVFNRKDALQARFAQRIAHDAAWHPPIWWLPSSRAFVDATLLGLGWTMNPLLLIQKDLDAGRLVMLRQRAFEDVPLYWQHWRIDAEVMTHLTQSVRVAAAQRLISP